MSIDFSEDFFQNIINTSKEHVCMLFTQDEIIPFRNGELQSTIIKGEDFINNKIISIEKSCIQSFTYYTDANDNHITQIIERFEKVKEYVDVDKVAQSVLYKNTPLYELIISCILNKSYDSISVSELKVLWLEYIRKQANILLIHIEQETDLVQDDSLLQSRNTLNHLKTGKELLQLKTKEDVCVYWPDILAPYPNFVNHKHDII